MTSSATKSCTPSVFGSDSIRAALRRAMQTPIGDARRKGADRAEFEHTPPGGLDALDVAAAATPARRLSATHRHTLQVIADRCTPLPDGSLVGCWGGQPLAQAIGVCLRTLWLHVKLLEHDGLLVTIARGGQDGRRNYVNVYGVPFTPGALDQKRVQRERRRMAVCDDGVYRPEVIHPGEQCTLWRRGEEHLPSRLRGGGRVKVTRGSCKSYTPPSPLAGR